MRQATGSSSGSRLDIIYQTCPVGTSDGQSDGQDDGPVLLSTGNINGQIRMNN